MVKFSDVAKNVATAIAVRLGTAAAVWLAAHGVPDDLVDQVATVVGVVGGLLFDLIMVFVLRRVRV